MGNEPVVHSIGIILDGNRRWARERGLHTLKGHWQGLKNLRALSHELPRLQSVYGLTHVTLYAFSTENWNRSEDEVSYLMKLFELGYSDILRVIERSTHAADNIRVRFIGQRERFSSKLFEMMEHIEKKTEDNRGVTVTFALSYGGRAEIVDALGKLRTGSEPVLEQTISEALWSRDIPDPDLIIRTGGEKRLSNFLTWSSVYSELFFTDTLWPDFTINELEGIFSEFALRDRRHGK